ncbi:hypothetical protein MAR621_03109 [Maribacter dokdonensis]|uniref:hypothetical protein n=1 Tax=Maribacter dokdonensis TaxID=320912 RepID=UPI001B25A6AF|nr:hypothetical protein [Maribacter dokdonensis]CAG2532915.1 hypothetical protein MAR621_03109 [Maribacter dokdonensis]
MTPTVEEIKSQILAKKAEYESLNGLDSTSKTASFNLWAYIVAFVIYVQYQFFAIFQTEVDEQLANQKIFRNLWYRKKALEYRHGHPLVEFKDDLIYEDEGYTEQEIEEALVVKRAAVIELEITGQTFLFVKCATEVNGELAKLPDAQKEGIADYFKRIKTGGTKLVVFSDVPDALRLTIDFFYDPLVLTETGTRIDGTDNTPVQNAVRNYLKNLRFNGEFSVSELEDILQGLSGCSNREAYIANAESNYQTPVNWQVIDNTIVANSGYMEITEANLTINFTPKTVIN